MNIHKQLLFLTQNTSAINFYSKEKNYYFLKALNPVPRVGKHGNSENIVSIEIIGEQIDDDVLYYYPIPFSNINYSGSSVSCEYFMLLFSEYAKVLPFKVFICCRHRNVCLS